MPAEGCDARARSVKPQPSGALRGWRRRGRPRSARRPSGPRRPRRRRDRRRFGPAPGPGLRFTRGPRGGRPRFGRSRPPGRGPGPGRHRAPPPGRQGRHRPGTGVGPGVHPARPGGPTARRGGVDPRGGWRGRPPRPPVGRRAAAHEPAVRRPRRHRPLRSGAPGRGAAGSALRAGRPGPHPRLPAPGARRRERGEHHRPPMAAGRGPPGRRHHPGPEQRAERRTGHRAPGVGCAGRAPAGNQRSADAETAGALRPLARRATGSLPTESGRLRIRRLRAPEPHPSPPEEPTP
jgi:SWI/SNF-related matrix-associated actin-dependent regulator of chromatin subfamily A protein 2/4/collagen type III alpha